MPTLKVLLLLLMLLLLLLLLLLIMMMTIMKLTDRSNASVVEICLEGKDLTSEKGIKLFGSKLVNKIKFDPHTSDL